MTLPLRRLEPSRVAFLSDLARHGDRQAFLSADGSLSYRDLAARIDDRRYDLGSDRRLVLLTAGPDVATLVTYLACLAAGHPVVLTTDDAATVDALRQVYDPDVIIGATGELEPVRRLSSHDLHPDLALLLSTSGSTGSPKLVRLSYANVQANAEAIAASVGIRPTDRAITSLPLHYCYGLSVLHSHLAQGAGTVLTPLSVVDPCFWDLFRDTEATTLAGVPHTFALLDRVGFSDMDLPHLRYVTQAGGRLAPEQVRRFAEQGQRRGWDLIVMYGQTEATARMACLPPDLAASRPEAIGVPVPGGSFRIDPDGELIYSGPNVMLGYATEPGDLALGRTVDELRTGDLARQADDGLYEVIGRRSRFLKVFGLRIDLDRIEQALAGSGVAAALGSDDELVVVTEGSGDLQILRRQAAELSGLPLTAVRACQVRAIPRTMAGKVDGPALVLLTTPAAAPAPTTAGVLELYAAVLERGDVADGDTFVGLGGDSLSYVEVSLRLEDLLGHLPADWHLRTVAGLEATRSSSRRRWRTVETSVVLRAVAIVLIVAHHCQLFRILGGAHLLLGVAGYNFARFRLTTVARPDRLRGIAHATARVALPALAVVAAGTALTNHYGWSHWLFIHDLVDPFASNKDFWFVEVLLQVLAAITLLLAVPQLDRWERRRPLALPTVVLAVGLLARYDVLPAGTGKARLYAPFAIFWLFAWGWAAARCTTAWQRWVLTGVLVAALPGFFLDNRARELLVGGALLLLLWARRLRLPRRALPVIGVLASSSLYIYLAHYLVYRELLSWPLLAMAASFAVGIAYWQLAGRAMSALDGARRKMRGPVRSLP